MRDCFFPILILSESAKLQAQKAIKCVWQWIWQWIVVAFFIVFECGS